MKKVIALFVLGLLSTIVQSHNSSKYVIGCFKSGMGASILAVLNHLAYCKKHNLMPVVLWQGGLYHNPHGFNGKSNEWEYFFNPVSLLRYNSGDRVYHEYADREGGRPFPYNDILQEKRDFANKLMEKYICINKIVQGKVDQFCNMYMNGKRTIGIHIRGTDKRIEEKLVLPEDGVIEALKWADENTQFFIASDEKRIVDKMCALLKGKDVVYYNCYRSENSEPLHYGNYSYKPPLSQLGEDVIAEMWIMAKCDLLIHTISNVSAVALFLNPKLEHIVLS